MPKDCSQTAWHGFGRPLNSGRLFRTKPPILWGLTAYLARAAVIAARLGAGEVQVGALHPEPAPAKAGVGLRGTAARLVGCRDTKTLTLGVAEEQGSPECQSGTARRTPPKNPSLEQG
jgi:hypothetical protein